MGKRKDTDANGVLLYLLILISYVFTMITVDAISWTKYRYEGNSVEVTCDSEDIQVIAENVPDPFTCSKIGYIHDKSPSVYFESHTCIGCREFLNRKPNHAWRRSVHYSTRDFWIDCKDILEMDTSAESGVYEIRLRNSEKIPVYCDMTTDGGGWTVIQNRYDGSVEFQRRDLLSYVNGFGNVSGEFWLGLKYVQELTELPAELWFHISVMSGETAHEKYNHFRLTGTSNMLSVDTQPVEKSGMASNATNVFGQINGNEFHSYGSYVGECGGWWALPDSSCRFINFNLRYDNVGAYYGVVQSKLNTSRMMIRRR